MDEDPISSGGGPDQIRSGHTQIAHEIVGPQHTIQSIIRFSPRSCSDTPHQSHHTHPIPEPHHHPITSLSPFYPVLNQSSKLLVAMKLVLQALLLASSAYALRETVQEAALHARRLLREETVLTLSSVFSEEVNSVLAGQPFA
jgi:hypothetical protein